jgi:hypothetical protein
MAAFKKWIDRSRPDEAETGQPFERFLFLRTAPNDFIDPSIPKGFDPGSFLRRVDFDRTVAKAETRDRRPIGPVVIVNGVGPGISEHQPQYRKRIFLDRDRGCRARGEQAVMNLRQFLAEAPRYFLDLGTRDSWRRQQLMGQPRRQLQIHCADQSGGLIDIHRWFGVQGRRTRHDQLRQDALLARLPFDPALAMLSPTQRWSLVIEPKRAAGRNDLFQEVTRPDPMTARITSELMVELKQNLDV